MKLIDILVRELPKRGGWPEGVAAMAQDADGAVQNYSGTDHIRIHHDVATGNSRIPSSYSIDAGDVPASLDRLTAIITREQYEAALAASKQGWNGEGLPPVGCQVETLFNGEWVEATVAYTGRPESSGAADTCKWKEALVFDCKTTRPFWADEFRPIRSEAEKKRDEAVAKLTDAICGEVPDTGMATAANYAVRAYDAIAAGKVPGIRIE